MIKLYKLEEDVQEAVESMEILKENKIDEADENNETLKILRDEIELFIENRLDKVNLDYRSIKRSKTTSYVIKLFNNETLEDEEVKITIRFDEDNIYSSHNYTNLTFNRDLDFYVDELDF